MGVKSVVLVLGTVLMACSQTPPMYFGPQLASIRGEVDPQAINSPAYAMRPPPPAGLGISRRSGTSTTE